MGEDWRSAPVSGQVKAVLGFLEKFVPPESDFGAADIAALRQAGLKDDAIKEALYVSFCFQNLSRWADAFDWPLPTEKGLAMAGKVLWNRGYATGSVGPS